MRSLRKDGCLETPGSEQHVGCGKPELANGFHFARRSLGIFQPHSVLEVEVHQREGPERRVSRAPARVRKEKRELRYFFEIRNLGLASLRRLAIAEVDGDRNAPIWRERCSDHLK